MEDKRTTTYAKKEPGSPEPGTALATQSDGFLDTFTKAVIVQFNSVSTEVAFSPYQKRLAQHLFIKIDASLKDLEVKRMNTPAKQGNTPITWENINMEKLAVDAVDRIDLGLDALIPNHIHVIPYFNGRKKKYDLDLRVGYAGKDYYYRQMAVETPEDVVYELVYERDKFIPKKKSIHNKVESYEYEIEQPFKRGAVVGGFGYIMYRNPEKNKLILVSADDFDASAAKGNATFWKDYPKQMKWKKVVTATVTKLPLDPQKISRAFLAVEAQEDAMDAAIVGAEIEEKANRGPVIDITEGQQALTQENGVGAAPESDPGPEQPDAPADKEAVKALSFDEIASRLKAAKSIPELTEVGKLIDGPEGTSLSADEVRALKELGAKILEDGKKRAPRGPAW
jgi:recombination protein RecT